MKLIHKIKRFFGFDIPYSAILRDAKTRLANNDDDCDYVNKWSCICFTINANDKQRVFLREWITELLGGDPLLSLDTWLYVNHNISYSHNPEIRAAMSYDQFLEKVQQTRHAWLDWMIQHWEYQEAKEIIQSIELQTDYYR